MRISGNSLAGAWSADVPLAGMASGAGVAALWARARIGELMDGLRRGGDGDAMRRAIVETALQHRLVSKFTSLVAVDRTPVRPASDPLASEQVANRMPYGQNPGAIFGFPATATDAPWQRSVGVSCLLVALLLLAMIRAHRRRDPDAART